MKQLTHLNCHSMYYIAKRKSGEYTIAAEPYLKSCILQRTFKHRPEKAIASVYMNQLFPTRKVAREFLSQYTIEGKDLEMNPISDELKKQISNPPKSHIKAIA